MRLITEKTSLQTGNEIVGCTLVRGSDFGDVWHHHPACEITVVIKGGTERLVGDTLEPLKPGAMAFLGPDVPHDYRNSPLPGAAPNQVEAAVVHFMPHLLDSSWRSCASMAKLHDLFARARYGLRIGPKTATVATTLIMQILATNGLRRIITLLELLDLFSQARDLKEIATANFTLQPSPHTTDRIGKACHYIEENFAAEITLAELAHLTNLSESAFSRLFKKCTSCTVPQYINRLRIARVCRLLSESDLTVGEIMRQCGYASAANFQRQFRKIHNTSPQLYRLKLRK